MIRSNVGNMVTNATQTLAVTGTTAARTLGSADTALLNKQERRDYMAMRADQKREQIAKWKAGKVETIEELDLYDDMDENATSSISEIISPEMSKQSPALSKFVMDNIEYQQKWTARNLSTGRIAKVDEKVLEEELKKHADV